jgi:hypothetical protein
MRNSHTLKYVCQNDQAAVEVLSDAQDTRLARSQLRLPDPENKALNKYGSAVLFTEPEKCSGDGGRSLGVFFFAYLGPEPNLQLPVLGSVLVTVATPPKSQVPPTGPFFW